MMMHIKHKVVLLMYRVVHVVLCVELDSEKPLNVLRHLIVDVTKTYVLVLMVPKLLELLVLHITPIYVHRAPVDITKLAIHVLRVVQHVDLELD